MLFTPDTELSLGFVAALADTVPAASASGTDELDDPAIYAQLFKDWRYSGRLDHDAGGHDVLQRGDRRCLTKPGIHRLIDPRDQGRGQASRPHNRIPTLR